MVANGRGAATAARLLQGRRRSFARVSVLCFCLFFLMNVRERDRLGLLPCKIMELLVFLIDLNRIYIHQCVTFGQLSNYDTT